MTTVKQQKEMFYAAGRSATIKQLTKFIDQRHKERFVLIESLRSKGLLESNWNEVEEFDKDTDKQEQILQDMIV